MKGMADLASGSRREKALLAQNRWIFPSIGNAPSRRWHVGTGRGQEVTSLTEFLFPAPAPRGIGSILRWWESRRLPYNLFVGSAGLVSVGAVSALSWLPPGAGGVHIDLIPIVAFGVLANLCYLLGPAAEIGLDRLFRGKTLPAGPTLFRMGLTFSVGLALLPTLLAGLHWVFRVLRWLI